MAPAGFASSFGLPFLITFFLGSGSPVSSSALLSWQSLPLSSASFATSSFPRESLSDSGRLPPSVLATVLAVLGTFSLPS